MIELYGVSKSVPSGAGTLTILHPTDLIVPAFEAARRCLPLYGEGGGRDYRGLWQRQINAARSDRRP